MLRNNFTLAQHTDLSWKVLKTELHKKTSVQQHWHKSVYEFHLNLIVVAFRLLCFSKQYEVFLGEPSNPWFSKCSCGQWRIQDAELVFLSEQTKKTSVWGLLWWALSLGFKQWDRNQRSEKAFLPCWSFQNAIKLLFGLSFTGFAAQFHAFFWEVADLNFWSLPLD